MAGNGERVVLHVYDLSQGLARQLSFSILGKVIEAIYHTGVVVYGREYSFGAGIDVEPLGFSRYGTPIQALELGHTEVPNELFEEYLEEIRPRYTAETYSLLRHNCNNFSDEVAQFLVGVRVPHHILNLPQEVLGAPLGASLIPLLEQMEASARAQVRRQPAPALPLPFASAEPPNFASIQLPSSTQNPPLAANVGSHGSAAKAPAPTAVPTSSVTSAVLSSPEEAASAVARLAECSPPLGASSPRRSAPRESTLTRTAGASSSSAHTLKSNADPPSELTQVQRSDDGSEVAAAEEAKARVQSEIRREFALLMAAGQLQANEAAVQAVRRVMEKHRAESMGSGQAQS